MELTKLKALLGILPDDTSKNITLQFIIDDVEGKVLDYCHIEEIPERLATTCYRMAMDIYKNESMGQEDDNLQTKSLSEGDTSVSFEKRKYDDGYIDSIVKSYIPQLNKHRKLVW